MKTYHIYLLRHGMTEGNKKGQYIGSTDIPLCEEGIQQLCDISKTYVYPAAELLLFKPAPKMCSDSQNFISRRIS
jgi:alpha-ribazole phosphatase